jgi:hypothetical protein
VRLKLGLEIGLEIGLELGLGLVMLGFFSNVRVGERDKVRDKARLGIRQGYH